MKILLVANMHYVPAQGGAIKVYRYLLEALAARGHDCRVVVRACSPQNGPATLTEFRADLEADGISLIASSDDLTLFRSDGVEVHAVTDATHLPIHLMQQIKLFAPHWTLVGSEDPGQVLLAAALQVSPDRVVSL